MESAINSDHDFSAAVLLIFGATEFSVVRLSCPQPDSSIGGLPPTKSQKHPSQLA